MESATMRVARARRWWRVRGALYVFVGYQKASGAMIYGLNFNRTPIPLYLARYFRKRLTGGWFLQGVATTQESRDVMLVQADNGHRKLRTMPKQTRFGQVWGVYVG
jgi:hypothetical protein